MEGSEVADALDGLSEIRSPNLISWNEIGLQSVECHYDQVGQFLECPISNAI